MNWTNVNKVKKKLKEGKVSIGPWILIAHPDIAEILSIIGFDFIIYDTEHAPLSVENIQLLMQAMVGPGVVPLVRVAWNDPVLIKRSLDIGAYGVLIPRVNNQEEARMAVKACRYPPRGIRGCSPRRAAHYGLHFQEYFEHFAQEEILIMVQIETRQALDNLDEILSVEGIDVAYIGPLDLSVSLGVPRKWNSSIFKDAIGKVLKKCKEHNVVSGIHCRDLTDVKERVRQGFQFITFFSDTEFLLSAAKEAHRHLAVLTDNLDQESR